MPLAGSIVVFRDVAVGVLIGWFAFVIVVAVGFVIYDAFFRYRQH